MGSGISIQKIVYRDFGPTIDLLIKLEIYLKNRWSGHEFQLSMIKFCELVLIPHSIELKQFRQVTWGPDCFWGPQSSHGRRTREKFLYLHNCFSQENGTILYYALFMSHKGLLGASITIIMVIIKWLEVWKICHINLSMLLHSFPALKP